jgi:hypothetical protein
MVILCRAHTINELCAKMTFIKINYACYSFCNFTWLARCNELSSPCFVQFICCKTLQIFLPESQSCRFCAVLYFRRMSIMFGHLTLSLLHLILRIIVNVSNSVLCLPYVFVSELTWLRTHSTLVSLLIANTDECLIGLTDKTEYYCLPALLGSSPAKI